MEQYNRVNEAFRIRISEIRESKTKMEVKHAEVCAITNNCKIRSILFFFSDATASERNDPEYYWFRKSAL